MSSGISSGQMFGAVLGAAVGFFFPPAGLLAAGLTQAGIVALGATLGMTVGGIIDPLPQQTIYQEGPRLGDLSVQTSEWGIPIRRLFGTYKLTGNIIWALDLQETKHVEESGEGKGGGGGTKTSTTWYSYTGSWAVGLCEGEITGINKIWFDSVLVYDSTNYAGGLKTSNHTIYKGSLDQSIDWLMASDNEDTPAYRGLCYIVFNGIELENYGNKIPKVSCEIVGDGEIPDTLQMLSNVSFPPPDTSLGWTYGRYVWGINANPHNGVVNSVYSNYKLLQDGKVVAVSTELNLVWAGLGGCHNKSYDGSNQALHFWAWNNTYKVYGWGNGAAEFWATEYPTNALGTAYTNNLIDHIDGRKFTYIRDNGLNAGAHRWYMELTNMVGGKSSPALLTRIDSYEYWGVALWNVIPYNGGYCVITIDSMIHILDSYFSELSSFSITKPNDGQPDYRMQTTYGNGQLCMIGENNGEIIFSNGSATIYAINIYAINVSDESVRHVGITESSTDFRDASLGISYYIEEDILYYVYMYSDHNRYMRFNLNNLSNLQVTLASICEELFLRAGIVDFDVSEGTSELVDGYVIPNPMTTRAAITSIISAYGYELIETGFEIKLKKRDPDPVIGTISNIIDFVEIERRQTVELARQINISYANKNKNYDAGIQTAIRVDSNTENIKNYQFALSLTDTKAKQIAEMFLFSEWNERLMFKFSLPLEYMYLEPSNTIPIESNGSVFNVRLTKIDYTSNGQLNCEASLENSSIYISNAIGSDTGESVQEAELTGSTTLEILDIPMLDNIYNYEGVYIAANGYLSGWPGCNIDKSTDQEVSYNSIGTIIDSTIIGFTTTKLLSGTTTTIDVENEVTISLIDEIYDISIEELFNAKNYIVIGNEVLQYQYALDNGDSTYTLSNLLRGRRGTEWAIDTHSIGERFVFLDTNMIFDSSATLNVNSYYKATTFGDFREDSTAEYIVPEIRCLKPLSVSMVYGTRDSNNNLTINWMRRSRDVTGYMKTLQLLEEVESYEIDIITGSGRTLTSSSESVIYTAEDQITDGATLGDPVTIEIYQMSGIVGRGYAFQETV